MITLDRDQAEACIEEKSCFNCSLYINTNKKILNINLFLLKNILFKFSVNCYLLLLLLIFNHLPASILYRLYRGYKIQEIQVIQVIQEIQ